MSSKNEKKCIVERRKPKMLKEFLQDNSTPSYSSPSQSCSSSGFNSIPRRVSEPDPFQLSLLDQAAATLPRSRSRSRTAAEITVSSFQKLLNVVKLKIHYFSSTTSLPASPLTLTRSISKRLIETWSGDKKRRKSKSSKESKVKVKDILRWKDLADNNDVIVLDDVLISIAASAATPSPRRSSGSSSNGSISGSRSSWGDSEFSFTMGELPCWWSNSSGEDGKEWNKQNNVVKTESDVGPSKEDNCSVASEEDKEQHSPVSVLDSPFREETSDEEFGSSFDQSLANVEKTKQKLLDSIKWFESLAGGFEEDDEIEAVQEEEQEQEQGLELRRERNATTVGRKINLSKAFCRLKGAGGGQALKEMQECIKDMEKQGQWNMFEEEKEELGVEVEFEVFSDLVNEVLVDLFG